MSAIEAKSERIAASARELSTTFAKEIAPDASVEGIRFVFNQLAGLLNRKLPSVGAFHEAVRVPADGRTIPVDVIVPAGDGSVSGGRLLSRRRVGGRQSREPSQVDASTG